MSKPVRGRPRSDEPAYPFTIRLPERLYRRARRLTPAQVRAAIDAFMPLDPADDGDSTRCGSCGLQGVPGACGAKLIYTCPGCGMEWEVSAT